MNFFTPKKKKKKNRERKPNTPTKTEDRAKVYEMRSKGISFTDIGIALGISRQRAYQQYEKKVQELSLIIEEDQTRRKTEATQTSMVKVRSRRKKKDETAATTVEVISETPCP